MLEQLSRLTCALTTKRPSVNTNKETFTDSEQMDLNTDAVIMYNVVYFLFYILVLVLLLTLGKFLWNEVLVNLVTVVKPMSNVYEVFGLYLLLFLLSPR